MSQVAATQKRNDVEGGDKVQVVSIPSNMREEETHYFRSRMPSGVKLVRSTLLTTTDHPVAAVQRDLESIYLMKNTQGFEKVLFFGGDPKTVWNFVKCNPDCASYYTYTPENGGGLLKDIARLRSQRNEIERVRLDGDQSYYNFARKYALQNLNDKHKGGFF